MKTNVLGFEFLCNEKRKLAQLKGEPFNEKVLDPKCVESVHVDVDVEEAQKVNHQKTQAVIGKFKDGQNREMREKYTIVKKQPEMINLIQSMQEKYDECIDMCEAARDKRVNAEQQKFELEK